MSCDLSNDVVQRRPFNHDKSRGKWSHPMDFIFACAGHAFKGDTILFMSMVLSRQLGVYGIPFYFLILAVCIVPITFIQSYLGQFSSTGFISAFRIAPLFKGVGYLSMVLNVMTLAYYTIFSAVPLILSTYVLQVTIPWNCEGLKDWRNRTEFSFSPCEESGAFKHLHFLIHAPTMTFYHANGGAGINIWGPESAGFSWFVFLWSCIVWAIVAVIVIRPIEKIGLFVRYSYGAVFGAMLLLLLRFMLLPGAFRGLKLLFKPLHSIQHLGWFTILYVALSTLGPGWGSTITMASFNDFKTNIFKFSWILSCVHFGIALCMTLLSLLMAGFVLAPLGDNAYDFSRGDQRNDFLLIPTGLTLIEMPRFWLLVFFGMLFLGSLNLLVMQLVSVLTSVFDEFEALRINKRGATLTLVGILALSFSIFCWEQGFLILFVFMQSSFIIQAVLNLLLLLAVLWVYDPERFHRDVVFMTSQMNSNLMMIIIQFLAPLVLIIGTIVAMMVNYVQFLFHSMWAFLFTLPLICLALISMCLIPCCSLYQVITMRLKRSVEPLDWYPADPEYRQQYEETVENLEIPHQPSAPKEEDSMLTYV